MRPSDVPRSGAAASVLALDHSGFQIILLLPGCQYSESWLCPPVITHRAGSSITSMASKHYSKQINTVQAWGGDTFKHSETLCWECFGWVRSCERTVNLGEYSLGVLGLVDCTRPGHRSIGGIQNLSCGRADIDWTQSNACFYCYSAYSHCGWRTLEHEEPAGSL